jgi:CheY-like chemotaxis protein
MVIEKKTVLVVDDEPDIRKLVSKMLRNKYTVLEAQNGQAAIDMALQNKPDLVLMDIMMPGIDGLTACFQIKQHDTSGNIRVVMLTAVNYELNKKLSTSVMKADGYITKPFDQKTLMNYLGQILSLNDTSLPTVQSA